MTNSGEPVQSRSQSCQFSVLSRAREEESVQIRVGKFGSSENTDELYAAQNRQRRWWRPRVATRKRDPASFFIEDGIFFSRLRNAEQELQNGKRSKRQA
jgi:hypothetical protein